jgi:PPOX class probable F420-dependent enzyme
MILSLRCYTFAQEGPWAARHPKCTVSQRRKMPMDIAVAQQFLRENENAVLATWRQDGRLQMSPVTVGLDAAGRAIISSRETAYKVRNLRRDPRAALCVFVEAFTGPWVQIEGTAEVVTLPEAMEPLVDYYRRLAGEHPDWEDYRRAMTADQRVLIRMTIERAGPDRQG